MALDVRSASHEAAAKEEAIVLTVRLLSGAEVAVIRAKPCETIRSVKREIEAAEGTPVKQLRLLHGQEILSNRLTVAQAGLIADTALQLVRLGPEEPPPPTASGKVEVLDLEDWKDIDDKPTEDEIDEFAEWLGMDPDKDAHLLWIAEAGLKAPLPRHWRPCRTPDGDIFYFNFQTGKSVWDHPCDAQYRELYRMHKMKERLPQQPEEPRVRRTAPVCRHRMRQVGRNAPAAGAGAGVARGEDGAAAAAQEAQAFKGKGNRPRQLDLDGTQTASSAPASASSEAPSKAKGRRLRHLDLGDLPAASSAPGSASSEDPLWELPRRVLASSPHGLYGPQAWRQLISAAGVDLQAAAVAASSLAPPSVAANVPAQAS